MNKNWLASNTFHYSRFGDLGDLVEQKQKKNLKISLCLPTLNEEKTIAKEIIIMKSELMTRHPLLDEIVVIDSGSTDDTVKIAESFDAKVYRSEELLPEHGFYKGKGENLWKALFITRGDIIVYLDADIKNIHHRFCYGLLGPLLLYDHIKVYQGLLRPPHRHRQKQDPPHRRRPGHRTGDSPTVFALLPGVDPDPATPVRGICRLSGSV